MTLCAPVRAHKCIFVSARVASSRSVFMIQEITISCIIKKTARNSPLILWLPRRSTFLIQSIDSCTSPCLLRIAVLPSGTPESVSYTASSFRLNDFKPFVNLIFTFNCQLPASLHESPSVPDFQKPHTLMQWLIPNFPD